MTNKRTVLALVAAAGTWAAPALAVTTLWGVHDALEVAAPRSPTGVFEDLFLFSLVVERTLMSTSVSNNLGSILGLDDSRVSLFKEAGDAYTALGSYNFNGSTGNLSFPFGALDAGSYYFRVNGAGTGSAGGFYAFNSTLSEVPPVPKPNNIAPMLAGFAGMGVLLRRRRQESR